MATPLIDKEKLAAELAAAVKGCKTELQAAGAALATTSKHIARRTEANLEELRMQLRAAPTGDGPTEVAIVSTPPRATYLHTVQRNSLGQITSILSEPLPLTRPLDD